MIDEQNAKNKKADTDTPLTPSNGEDQGKKNTGNPEANTKSPSGKFRIRERFARWRERRRAKWEKTEIHDRINVRHNKVIAYSTFLYMFFAGWTLLEIHTSSNKGLTLQTEIAKAAYGPDIEPETMGIFREESAGIIGTRVWFKNLGAQYADKVRIAIKIEVRPSEPTDSERGFNDDEFLDATPRLLPITKIPNQVPLLLPDVLATKRIYQTQYSAYKGMNVYVWGEIRYKDFTGPNTETFCRYIRARHVFDVKNLSEGGMYGSIIPCGYPSKD